MAAFVAFTTAAPYAADRGRWARRDRGRPGLRAGLRGLRRGQPPGLAPARRAGALAPRAPRQRGWRSRRSSRRSGLALAGVWAPWALVVPAAAFALATGRHHAREPGWAPSARCRRSRAPPSGLAGFMGTLIAALATQAVGALSDGTPVARDRGDGGVGRGLAAGRRLGVPTGQGRGAGPSTTVAREFSRVGDGGRAAALMLTSPSRPGPDEGGGVMAGGEHEVRDQAAAVLRSVSGSARRRLRPRRRSDSFCPLWRRRAGAGRRRAWRGRPRRP